MAPSVYQLWTGISVVNKITYRSDDLMSDVFKWKVNKADIDQPCTDQSTVH